jgi:predicted DNA-binding protein (MmcQ/YjbR family)
MDSEAIRAFCLSLPATTEEIKWDNDLCFSVGGKMYVVMSTDMPMKCAFKVQDEEFEALSQSPGIIPAPYMARIKWVQVQEARRLDHAAWAHYLRQSYDLVKAKLTKKLRQELGI